MFFRCALLLAGAGFAVAQAPSLGGLSQQCTSALVTVLGSPDSSCINPQAILPIGLATNTSAVPAINTWLTGLCALGPCSNSSLSAIVANITSGCSAELQSIGLTPTANQSLPAFVEAYYPTLRQVLCLEDTSVGELCPVEDLYSFQNLTGTTLTSSNVLDVASQLNTLNVSIPQNITCGSCSKASYSTVAKNFPQVVAGSQSSVQSYCGSSFTDGSIPSNIKETATNSSSSGSSGSGSSGAASLSVDSLTAGAATLVAVWSAFALFA